MNKYFLSAVLSILSVGAIAQAIPASELQIRTALLAAPPDKRDSATVYGYAADKELVVLREGTNEMICVADDPAQPGLSVSCYHRDLQPFMQRGRDLRTMGRTQEQIFLIREKEAKSGELILPKQPTTLYVYSAKDSAYNKKTGEVKNGYLRYVIYIPFATSASTGLTEKPVAPGMP